MSYLHTEIRKQREDVIHSIKHFIITHPERKYRSQDLLAYTFNVSVDTVRRVLKELNIPQRDKPLYYVG